MVAEFPVTRVSMPADAHFRIIFGSLRLTADHKQNPEGPFGWKNSCNAIMEHAPALRGPVTKRGYCYGEWWAVQDSNLRPPVCETGALTN